MKKRPSAVLALTPAQQAILKQAPSIYLVGLMGAGKSTVGRILANAFKRKFLDSDVEIVQRTGATIPTIFEIEGEEGFRDREARVITDLCAQPQVVLATGGGAVLRESSQKVLRNTGFVVYLSSTPERLLARTRSDKNRPLLQTEDPLTTLRKLYEIRHPIYKAVAHVEVKTGVGQVSRVAMSVVDALLQYIARQQGLTKPNRVYSDDDSSLDH